MRRHMINQEWAKAHERFYESCGFAASVRWLDDAVDLTLWQCRIVRQWSDDAHPSYALLEWYWLQDDVERLEFLTRGAVWWTTAAEVYEQARRIYGPESANDD